MDFPPPLVQHKVLFPAPIVQKTLAPVRNIVRRVFALGHHVHTCPSCGAEWSHADTNAHNTAAHTCPGCEKVLPAGWYPTARNMKIEIVQAPITPVESKSAAVVVPAPSTSAPVYNSTCPGGNCPQQSGTPYTGGFLRRIFGR